MKSLHEKALDIHPLYFVLCISHMPRATLTWDHADIIFCSSKCCLFSVAWIKFLVSFMKKMKPSFIFYLMLLKDQGPTKTSIPSTPYQKPPKSVRPPLIPAEDEQEKQEEGFFGSIGKLLVNTWASVVEILGAIFPVFRKKEPLNYEYQNLQYQQQQKHSNAWPMQESFVIPDEDEPPSIETRTPTPRKTYPFMSKDADKIHQLRQSQAFYNGWDGDLQQQQQRQYQHQHQQKQQQQQQHQQKQQQHHHRYYSSIPHTYYEQSCEQTNEVVFGAVQEQDGKRESVVIKPVDYGNPMFDHHNIRSRSNYMGYHYGYWSYTHKRSLSFDLLPY